MAVVARKCVIYASLAAASGGYSSLQGEGFSLLWLPLLRSTGSRARGLSSCGTGSQLLLQAVCYSGIRDLRRRGPICAQKQGLTTSRFLCKIILLKYKRDRESFWHRHQKGGRKNAPLLVLTRHFISVNQIRETPQGWRSFTRPLSHKVHFEIERHKVCHPPS